MNGVSQRIKAGQDIHGNVRIAIPDVCDRNAEEFRESAVSINAHPPRIHAEMPSPRQAVPAVPANDMPLPTDNVPFPEIVNIAPHRLDGSDELVADHKGKGNGILCPRIPVIDMYVRPANRGFMDPYQDIV